MKVEAPSITLRASIMQGYQGCPLTAETGNSFHQSLNTDRSGTQCLSEPRLLSWKISENIFLWAELVEGGHLLVLGAGGGWSKWEFSKKRPGSEAEKQCRDGRRAGRKLQRACGESPTRQDTWGWSCKDNRGTLGWPTYLKLSPK